MNILHEIYDTLKKWFTFSYQILVYLYNMGAGVIALVLMLVWVLCQFVVMIANFLAWAGENFEMVATNSPIHAAFPGGMAASVDFANAIFPVQECFDAFSFLGGLWLVVATIRVAKSLVPGWS